MEKGILYIVATPIGNLGDLTIRAKNILTTVDTVYCEDTRVTARLLASIESTVRTKSYHQHSSKSKTEEILQELAAGKQLALVSDAGTPGISDPGNQLVAAVTDASFDVVPIPGVSAVITALSISGFPTDKFVFMGFPPQKKKRNAYFENMAQMPYSVVLYESSHRILKTLAQMASILPEQTKICICRELTKKFETVYRGTTGGIGEMTIKEKGEFVIVVSK